MLENPLHVVSSFLELKFVGMLLDHGASVNVEAFGGWTPLQRALDSLYNSNADCFSVAKLLVERGADVNARDKDHETPLHFAVDFVWASWASGHLELKLVAMLLDHGAQVNVEGNQGRTPLHNASGYKSFNTCIDEEHFDVVQL